MPLRSLSAAVGAAAGGGGGWELWAWYAFMCAACALNLALLALAWRRVEARDAYGRAMKALGVPWVVECAWRSVFPSLYLQRFVFWDTPLNAIITDRDLACVGELAWVSQAALALCFIDRQATGGKKWVQLSGVLAVFIYVAAECTSYYNVATTNEYWCAVEVQLDGLAYLVMGPASVYLWCRSPGKCCSSSGKLFLTILSLTSVIYPLYNFLVDAPMYMARYRDDQSHHKQYLPFWEGLEDAAARRVVTHRLQDWQQDMFWMTTYFTVGAWSGILLMFAPRLAKDAAPLPDIELPDVEISA